MSRQTLENSNHLTIGYIETRSDGTQVLEDKNHMTLGYYDPKSNRTENANHLTVGSGNLLMTLLKP